MSRTTYAETEELQTTMSTHEAQKFRFRCSVLSSKPQCCFPKLRFRRPPLGLAIGAATRGLPGPAGLKPRQCPKRVRKSGFRLFSDSFEGTPGRTLSGLWRSCPRESLSGLFSDRLLQGSGPRPQDPGDPV